MGSFLHTYDFCFDGIKQGSIVSVGTYGNVKQNIDKRYFLDGFIKMNEVISPKKIIIYGSVFKELEQFLKEENLEYRSFPCKTYEFAKKVTAGWEGAQAVISAEQEEVKKLQQQKIQCQQKANQIVK